MMLTALMAISAFVQCILIALTTHWHHQDRRRMNADEARIDFEQKEIEVLQNERKDASS